eukprot:289846-Alexandrium_andersonii.AAC.1
MERRHEGGVDRPRRRPAARPIERRPLDLRRRRQQRPRGALIGAPEADPRSDPDPERLGRVVQEFRAALR